MSPRKYPRGVWYETDAKRFRVRLYRNKVPHLAGYYPTEEEAVAALHRLKARLAAIPKLPRNYIKPTPNPTFSEIAKSLHEDINPKSIH